MKNFYKPTNFNNLKLKTIDKPIKIEIKNKIKFLKKIDNFFGIPNYCRNLDEDYLEGWFLTNEREEVVIEFMSFSGNINIYCNSRNRITDYFIKSLNEEKLILVNNFTSIF